MASTHQSNGSSNLEMAHSNQVSVLGILFLKQMLSAERLDNLHNRCRIIALLTDN